jgi:hypothetical protein
MGISGSGGSSRGGSPADVMVTVVIDFSIR